MTPTQEPTALPNLIPNYFVYLGCDFCEVGCIGYNIGDKCPTKGCRGIMKKNISSYTKESVQALLEGIEERFAACKIRHWDDEDGEQKYYDLYDDSMLDKLLEQIREARR